MQHVSLNAIAKAMEHFGIKHVGQDHCAVPCKQCGRFRIVPITAVVGFKFVRLCFCDECVGRMQLAVAKPEGPKELVTA
jgi:hypothetical protein